MISLILTFALVGFLTWLLITYVPMPAQIKNLIVVVVVVLLIVYLLNVLGLLGVGLAPVRWRR